MLKYTWPRGKTSPEGETRIFGDYTLFSEGFGTNFKNEIVMWKHNENIYVSDKSIKIPGYKTIEIQGFNPWGEITPYTYLKKTIIKLIEGTTWERPERIFESPQWQNLSPEFRLKFKKIITQIIINTIAQIIEFNHEDKKLEPEYEETIKSYKSLAIKFKEYFDIDITDTISDPRLTLLRI